MAAANGRPVPEDGYHGAYILDLAAEIVAEEVPYICERLRADGGRRGFFIAADLQWPETDPANAGIRDQFRLNQFPPAGGNGSTPTPPTPPATTPKR